MLRILGSPKTLCDGSSRRDWLQAGGLGLFGLSLADLLKAEHSQAAAHPTFGKAKSCILLYLYGAPSQIETFDPKPEAPEEIRGELGAISSSVPGLSVGELLPNVAKIMDRVTTVRSMTHHYPIHGVAYATTSTPAIDVAMELNPRDTRHWPFLGSVIDYVEDRRSGGKLPEIPRNLALPWMFSSHRKGEVPRAGPYAAFLGQGYNPIWTTFTGEGTKPFEKTLAADKIVFRDPYMGITPNGRFSMSSVESGELTLDRLDRRRSLLQQFDQARRGAETANTTANFDRFRQMAFSMLASDRLKIALDVQREPESVRELYGMTLMGQASLVARRLVEAGGRLATVFWDEYGLAGSGWDTHWNHFPRMREELAPPFDRAFSGLILDLEARGMLDDTLVVCLSEHGRTPKLSKGNGGGRDHWSRAYSVVLAGAGVAAGKVVGRTDRIAGDVVENPISPKDIIATIYHLLGIDPHTEMTDRLGRPLPIAGEGRIRFELFA